MAVKVVPDSEMVNQKGVKFEPGPWITLDTREMLKLADPPHTNNRRSYFFA